MLREYLDELRAGLATSQHEVDKSRAEATELAQLREKLQAELDSRQKKKAEEAEAEKHDEAADGNKETREEGAHREEEPSKSSSDATAGSGAGGGGGRGAHRGERGPVADEGDPIDAEDHRKGERERRHARGAAAHSGRRLAGAQHADDDDERSVTSSSAGVAPTIGDMLQSLRKPAIQGAGGRETTPVRPTTRVVAVAAERPQHTTSPSPTRPSRRYRSPVASRVAVSATASSRAGASETASWGPAFTFRPNSIHRQREAAAAEDEEAKHAASQKQETADAPADDTPVPAAAAQGDEEDRAPVDDDDRVVEDETTADASKNVEADDVAHVTADEEASEPAPIVVDENDNADDAASNTAAEGDSNKQPPATGPALPVASIHFNFRQRPPGLPEDAFGSSPHVGDTAVVVLEEPHRDDGAAPQQNQKWSVKGVQWFITTVDGDGWQQTPTHTQDGNAPLLLTHQFANRYLSAVVEVTRPAQKKPQQPEAEEDGDGNTHQSSPDASEDRASVDASCVDPTTIVAFDPVVAYDALDVVDALQLDPASCRLILDIGGEGGFQLAIESKVLGRLVCSKIPDSSSPLTTEHAAATPDENGTSSEHDPNWSVVEFEAVDALPGSACGASDVAHDGATAKVRIATAHVWQVARPWHARPHARGQSPTLTEASQQAQQQSSGATPAVARSPTTTSAPLFDDSADAAVFSNRIQQEFGVVAMGVTLVGREVTATRVTLADGWCMKPVPAVSLKPLRELGDAFRMVDSSSTAGGTRAVASNFSPAAQLAARTFNFLTSAVDPALLEGPTANHRKGATDDVAAVAFSAASGSLSRPHLDAGAVAEARVLVRRQLDELLRLALGCYSDDQTRGPEQPIQAVHRVVAHVAPVDVGLGGTAALVLETAACGPLVEDIDARELASTMIQRIVSRHIPAAAAAASCAGSESPTSPTGSSEQRPLTGFAFTCAVSAPDLDGLPCVLKRGGARRAPTTVTAMVGSERLLLAEAATVLETTVTESATELTLGAGGRGQHHQAVRVIPKCVLPVSPTTASGGGSQANASPPTVGIATAVAAALIGLA